MVPTIGVVVVTAAAVVVVVVLFKRGLLGRGEIVLLASTDPPGGRDDDWDWDWDWADAWAVSDGNEDRRVGPLMKRRPRSRLLAIPFSPGRGEDEAGMMGDVDDEALLLLLWLLLLLEMDEEEGMFMLSPWILENRFDSSCSAARTARRGRTWSGRSSRQSCMRPMRIIRLVWTLSIRS